MARVPGVDNSFFKSGQGTASREPNHYSQFVPPSFGPLSAYGFPSVATGIFCAVIDSCEVVFNWVKANNLYFTNLYCVCFMVDWKLALTTALQKLAGGGSFFF